jgi:thiol:disulfide interchange protein DsbC
VRPALLLLIFLLTSPLAFAAGGTVASSQPGSMQLTKESAIKALKGIQGEVLSVNPAEISGLYLVTMRMQGRVVPIYLDGSGSYLFTGNVIRLKDRKNLTEAHYQRLNPVDISTIPLDDALIVGNPEASQHIIVFTDPHCPYCSKLHKVLQEAVNKNPDLAFYNKLIPLKPSSKQITQTILCNKSLEQLEQAFAGKSLPEPSCKTDTIEKNLMLAQQLGIHGTPTLILPNGQLSPGYKPLDELLKLIEESKPIKK